MSLYALRKKIQEELVMARKAEKESAVVALKIIERELDNEIFEIKHDISKLEKEIHELYTKEGPQNWERELLINKEVDVLRGVLGK